MVAAMVSASYALAPFSSNNIAEQITLLSFLLLASRPLTLHEYRVECTAQVFRRSSGPGPLSKHGAQAVPRLTELRPHFSSLMCALLRLVDSFEGRCSPYFRRLLPNVQLISVMSSPENFAESITIICCPL